MEKVYVDANFGGFHTHIFESAPDFTKISIGGVGTGVDRNWNDIASSFVIRSGTWAFFKDINFNFQQGSILGPGLYPFVEWFGIDNDSLSSVRLISG